jgi:hypothetical protein
LLVAGGLLLTGWFLYARATTFGGVLAAEILLGGGMAFASGADSALLFLSLEPQRRASAYVAYEGRVRAAAQAGEALSSAVGGYLYTLAPRLPLWLEVPAAACALGTVGVMREAPRTTTGERVSHARRALGILRSTMRHARLRAAMALSVTLSLSSYVLVWLIQPYMQRRGVPLAWFGPIWAFANAWVGLVSLSSGRVREAAGTRTTLLACCLLVATGYGCLGLSTSPYAVAFHLLIMTVRGLQVPILASVLQEDAPEADRASVLSLNALLFRLAFVACGPPIGRLVERVGMERGLLVIGATLSASALGALRALAAAERRHGALDRDRGLWPSARL